MFGRMLQEYLSRPGLIGGISICSKIVVPIEFDLVLRLSHVYVPYPQVRNSFKALACSSAL